ncbi:flavin reductase family protein [Streptacidiphilus jiangxiensis]|uniref:NADH-FMN oxidoreductase RutF, flavin reductase (DIM6/NTAB) family n=1 Tax=Streptacidiphilus jiangxiensis TaxID=235985 RepID=A0A1H7KKC2_STRJI|nr:flavin reductase family protein [Streptacidiphilus jiangxiensis]SEK86445.1 NADH-FMN oxidoreductase RutF, flavin reductase (DIM6/NTAB) family [Streptacidiphilus jiangxiensis]
MTVSDIQQPDLSPAVDGRTLRSVCGLFVTGVTVITSGAGDTATGTTVNSFTSVSLDPPLVLFCLHRDSRLRSVVEQSQAFAVNFLSSRQEQLALSFAGAQTADFGGVRHQGSATGVPVLSEALAYLSCRLVNEFDGGDHAIYLGEVVELGLPQRHHDPLIFFRGSLGALEDQTPPHHPIFDG